MPYSRFGRNDPIVDAARARTLSGGIAMSAMLPIPWIITNPALTNGDGVFIQNTVMPWEVLVPTGLALSLISFSIKNLNATLGASQFYGFKFQWDSDAIDTGAALAIFNSGKSDSIYLNVAGKAGGALTDNKPTGIGIDINKEIASSAQRSASSMQQGIQIFDWSTTNQGVGGPRPLLIQKVSNLNSDHFLMTLRANRNMQQMVVVSGDAGYNGGMPVWRLDDETTSANWLSLVARGEFVFNQDGRGIQWVTPGSKTAYIIASTNDLKLKSGGTGIRFVNQADTQFGILMQDNLDVILGLGAPATSATAGFPHLPLMNGAPVSSPTTYSGWTPTVIDKVSQTFWYFDGSWKSINNGASVWLNVRDYGAVGDGTTDDTTAIQAALTAAAGNGYTVYFPAGQYKITTTLEYSSDTTLRGEHGQSWLTNYITASPWIVLTHLPNYVAENVVIENMGFNQRSDVTGFDADSYCVGINEVESLRITGCVFRKINTMAIWCDTKTADSQTRHIEIDHCWIQNSEGGGISLFGDIADVTVSDNLIENCKDDAIAVQDLSTGESPNGIIIAHNQILTCDRRNSSSSTPNGIRIYGCTNIVVDGNYIDKVVSCCIEVQEGSAVRSSNAVISNNVCRRAGVTVDSTSGVPLVGIYCLDSDRVNVIGNEITDSGSVGIAVTDCDQILLVSNQQYNNTTTNVSIQTSTNVQQWLTGAENAVRGGMNVGTSSDQTEGRLTIKGNTDSAAAQIYIYPSEHATSRRATITLDNWQLGQDLDANGVKDWYLFDAGTGATRIRISASGAFYLNPASGDLYLGNSSASIGLYSASPVGRATTSSASAAFVSNSGSTVNTDSTFDGYTLQQIVRALRSLGALT